MWTGWEWTPWYEVVLRARTPCWAARDPMIDGGPHGTDELTEVGDVSG